MELIIKSGDNTFKIERDVDNNIFDLYEVLRFVSFQLGFDNYHPVGSEAQVEAVKLGAKVKKLEAKLAATKEQLDECEADCFKEGSKTTHVYVGSRIAEAPNGFYELKRPDKVTFKTMLVRDIKYPKTALQNQPYILYMDQNGDWGFYRHDLLDISQITLINEL